MIKKVLVGALALSIFATSCSGDDNAPEVNNNEVQTSPLTVNFTGIESLGSDFVYEGWIIVNGIPVSTGTFSSVVFPKTFQVNSSDLEVATAFVLSIEPAVDLDPDPAATKVLAGDFNGNVATVSTGIVGDFSAASGDFFLRTPTDETMGNNGNDENGVWFGIPGMPPMANFNLPVLPEGWIYEGWVVGDTGPLTTGTFTDFSEADGQMPHSGPQSGPPIPGEDFFTNAPAGEFFPLDIRGRTIVISIEPVPDDSLAPFAMKPLLGTAGQITAPTTYSFGQNLNSLPIGSVSR
jgi:hypothetical protein